MSDTPSLDNLIAAQSADPTFVKENFGTLIQWYARNQNTRSTPTLKSLLPVK